MGAYVGVRYGGLRMVRGGDWVGVLDGLVHDCCTVCIEAEKPHASWRMIRFMRDFRDTH